jgi:hypothetical protein
MRVDDSAWKAELAREAGGFWLLVRQKAGPSLRSDDKYK